MFVPKGSWRKSDRSAANEACVEVVPGQEAESGLGAAGVRDSKQQNGSVLVFGPAEWNALLSRVKRGECDL